MSWILRVRAASREAMESPRSWTFAPESLGPALREGCKQPWLERKVRTAREPAGGRLGSRQQPVLRWPGPLFLEPS